MESRFYAFIALVVATLFGALMGAILAPTVMNFFGGGVDVWTGAAIGAVLVFVIGAVQTLRGGKSGEGGEE
jgi:hypothetical protein